MLIHVGCERVNDSFTLYLFFLTFLGFTSITFVIKNTKLFLKVTWDLASNYLRLLFWFASTSKTLSIEYELKSYRWI